MPNITENSIEQNLIDLLTKQNYRYLHGSQIERSFDGVVLEEEFKNSLKRLNSSIPSIRPNRSVQSHHAYRLIRYDGE
jgi:type I site-specific restriction-modification system R (restriction) subunit